MANTLITPQIVAREATLVLQDQAVTYGLMRNTSHMAEFTGAEKVGDTIKIRTPAPADVRLFTGTATPRDLTEGSVDLLIERHFFDQIVVTQKDWTLELDDFTARVVTPIMKAFAEELSSYAASKIALVPNFVGTAGEPPSSIAELAALGARMDTQKAPVMDRIGLVDQFAKESLMSIDTFHEADKRGDGGSALRSRSMGEIFGFDWIMDQLIGGDNKHTAGTYAAASPVVDVSGGVLEGATIMDIDGAAGTETILAGDLFTVAAVVDEDGNPRQFVFTNDQTAIGGQITGSTFFPAAPAGGFPDDNAITITASHTKNVGFVPGAFTAVAFPPDAPRGAGASNTFFDLESQFGMSVVFDYTSSGLADIISFQLLAGAQLQQADLATVLLG